MEKEWTHCERFYDDKDGSTQVQEKRIHNQRE